MMHVEYWVESRRWNILHMSYPVTPVVATNKTLANVNAGLLNVTKQQLPTCKLLWIYSSDSHSPQGLEWSWLVTVEEKFAHVCTLDRSR